MATDTKKETGTAKSKKVKSPNVRLWMPRELFERLLNTNDIYDFKGNNMEVVNQVIKHDADSAYEKRKEIDELEKKLSRAFEGSDRLAKLQALGVLPSDSVDEAVKMLLEDYVKNNTEKISEAVKSI